MANKIPRKVTYAKARKRADAHPDKAARCAPERQEGHPNLNRGGNEGNVFGAGRLRTAVRNRCVVGFAEGVDDLIKVATGKAKIPDRDVFGVRIWRAPTPEEKLRAMDLLGKYGLGTKIDLTSEDSPVKAYVSIDLGRVRGDEPPDDA